MQTIKKALHRNSLTSNSSVGSSEAITSPTTDNTSVSSTGERISETKGNVLHGGSTQKNKGLHTDKTGEATLLKESSLEPNPDHRKRNSDLSEGKVTNTSSALKEQVAHTHHVHNVEEVTRQRDIEKHQHHVQVYHQPIVREDHTDEKIHHKAHPVTNIHEKRASHAKDSDLLAKVTDGHGHKTGSITAPVQHEIHDNGETIRTDVHHHVHNVVVPLVQHDTHEHHRIHTTIPIHHVIHEAPIIHEASRLEPITHSEAVKRGNILGSKTSQIQETNLLHPAKHERKVDGVAEQLAKEMNLARANSPALGI